MNHADEPTQPTPTSPEASPSGPSPLAWIASGVLVFALLAGIAWFAMTTSRQGQEAAMRDTARRFLTAVAEADAASALGRLADPPANTTLLTDAALTASRETAPLTDLAVGDVGGTETNPTVDVTYKLGDRQVATTITLTAQGGGWKVTDGTATLIVPERRGFTVNGVTLTEEVNAVFPGTYTAAVTSNLVALAGERTVTVTAPDTSDVRLDVSVGLSDLGSQTVLNTVKDRFDQCLAATEAQPAHCPFGASTEGVDVAEGSVRFTLVNDPWAGFAPTLDPDTLIASGTFPYSIDATATITRDGMTMDAPTHLAADRGYEVDLTKAPAVVTWK